MGELLLRWEGKVGAMKPWALMIGIAAALALLLVIGELKRTLQNPTGPVTVTVHDLATGQIASDRYITVSGTALYSTAYQETSDGAVTAIVYPLVAETKDVVFVRSNDANLLEAEDQAVTISGITHSLPHDLQSLVARDASDIKAAGFGVSATVYVVQGQKPVDLGFVSLETVAALGVALLCLTTLFFPSTVFHPKPVQNPAQFNPDKQDAQVNGRLQEVKTLYPEPVFGRGTRKFHGAVANLFTSKEGWLGVYVHSVLTYSVYQVPVASNASDWGVILPPRLVVAIQPGVLYKWHRRPAVSIQYRPGAGKLETLILSFEHSGTQAKLMEELQAIGYPVNGSHFAKPSHLWPQIT